MATPPLPSDLAVAQQVVKECGHVECSENATHMTSASACAPCLAQALARVRREQREAGMSEKVIVLCDTKNQVLDEAYAEQLRAAFRRQTGWKVEAGTRIYQEVTEFSKGYSVKKRDVDEVAAIFRLAHGLMKVKPTP